MFRPLLVVTTPAVPSMATPVEIRQLSERSVCPMQFTLVTNTVTAIATAAAVPLSLKFVTKLKI